MCHYFLHLRVSRYLINNVLSCSYPNLLHGFSYRYDKQDVRAMENSATHDTTNWKPSTRLYVDKHTSSQL